MLLPLWPEPAGALCMSCTFSAVTEWASHMNKKRSGSASSPERSSGRPSPGGESCPSAAFKPVRSETCRGSLWQAAADAVGLWGGWFWLFVLLFPPPRSVNSAVRSTRGCGGWRSVAEGGGRAARFGGWAIVVPLSRVSGEMVRARSFRCAQLPRFRS